MSYSNLSRVSQNLALRKSPERKCPPSKTFFCPPLCAKYSCHCCDCLCYNCCHCCCNPCCTPCLHFDYSSGSSNLGTKKDEGNNLKNSQNLMESKKIKKMNLK